ncbi:MAG: gliding motility-associated ABC transporter ATP-binding subunit GldA [Bacteroidota bacterium]|nr:gliding motility-associated ABC transporter ATP-binding subunit GldA [Bacteroidota bacterium]
MSIEITDLSKNYGQQTVLDQVNLSLKPGQITGLLGPNGAGKSTLMKIIACFIPPSKGCVTVYGHDVMQDAFKVRQLIGYLPENNPLYPEMYVREFLLFIAGLYNLGKQSKARVDELITMTGLTTECNKKIGLLSKGYKQRVGLAQALMNDPQALILDEPTSGLDPNQLTEIRNLIREIGLTRIVLFSTHIMQEVEALCQRTVIINKGKIVADDDTVNISGGVEGKEIITVEFETAIDASILKALKGVTKVISLSSHKYEIEAVAGSDIRAEVFKFAVEQKWVVIAMQKEERNLEDVFRSLTI